MHEAIGITVASGIVPNTNGMKQTVVLVEDEEMVRNLLCEVLRRVGFEVLACANPEEGIAVCRSHPGKIDLLLTDVVMPGMNGREMANRIQETLPELCVVFMSGYTEQVLLQEGQMDAPFEYLQKPFTLRALTQKVAKVLGNTEERAQ
jgi:two-component system, cell cycle sensor histidine kinase and response regulator CckA